MREAQVNKHAIRSEHRVYEKRERERERQSNSFNKKFQLASEMWMFVIQGQACRCLLLMLALTISLASRSVHGPRRWNNFNNKRQSPSQKAAASLVSLTTCPQRVSAFNSAEEDFPIIFCYY